MEVISLKCNSCGSDLQVNGNTRFFNCSFCGSSLALKKSGNAVFTEVLNEIKGDTEAILDTSEKLLLEKQIARLDRDWEKESQNYDLESLEGNSNIIGPIISLLIFCSVAFAFFYKFQQNFPNHSIPPVFKVLPIGIGAFIIFFIVTNLISSNNSNSQMREYQKKELIYENRRKELLNKIEEID